MKRYFFISLTLLSFFFLSCEDEKNAKVEVWLTDDEGNFKEVNIDIEGVEIHSNAVDNERGWRALEVAETKVNLLTLTNGKELKLGELELPGGRISQIRLKLGDENNVMLVNGEIHPLSTPSAQQSGLKLQIHQVLAEGLTYKILLDFDAAQSVVQTGAESYSLKPVLRAVMDVQEGIKGTISPADAPAVVIKVMSGEETVATTGIDESGGFLLKGLAAGTYRVVISAEGYQTVEKADVIIEAGKLTDLGVIELIQ